MNAEAWDRLNRIFDEARELPPARRQAFVAGACGGDEQLRAEALSLLAADEVSGEFLSKPAFERFAQTVASEGWSLQPGERIGAYTVVRKVGSGGAGEVWQATDERLGRNVAIKVLLPHWTTDIERLRRFAEEARAAGALNHSNILTVYDVGEHRGVPFLVSEYLEGVGLRRRLESGPLPVREAVAIAIGIARGLAAAHARGIIHRDLKPENTFIRPDGVVKILDFGLAKLQTALESGNNPTHTATGVIAGTAGYMAPEQVKSEPVDGRADLFALGVMLYEMLAGRNPFRGGSTFETLHAVLTVDPADLLEVQDAAPPELARIVSRLLQKAPDARFQSAIDLIWALEQVESSSMARGRSARPLRDRTVWWQSRWMPWIAAPALTGLAIFLGASLLRTERGSASDQPLMQFTWALPPGVSLVSAPVVSPDSRFIAFAGRDAAGSRLYVRPLQSQKADIVPGSERARQPFWSPDSRWLGFFTVGAKAALMKAAWPDGAPAKVTDVFFGLGGSWGRSDVILFGPDIVMDGLRRVPSSGGNTAPATLLDSARGDNTHSWPTFLPDGIHFLYFVRSIEDERRGVYLGRLDRTTTAEDRMLFRSESEAIYAEWPDTSGGALLSVNNGRIEVRRFDTTRHSIDAEVRTLEFTAGGNSLTQPAMLSASRDVLVFAASMPFGDRLQAVNRSGEHLKSWQEPEPQNWPRVSPDGGRIVRQRVDLLTNNPDIWVEDLQRDTRVRITTSVEPDIQPVWSPDGRRLAYISGRLPGRPGTRTLSIAAADGTGVVQVLPCPREYCEATDWTTDDHLIVNVRDPGGGDVWIVPINTARGARPLLAEGYDERDARIAPRRDWIAYVSNESGRPEVSVRSVAGGAKRIVISASGGDQPVWRRDGSELFFVDPQGRLQSASVTWNSAGTPVFGRPTALPVPPVGFGHWGTQYDVSPDGRQIYFVRRNDETGPREIQVVLGWRGLLKS